MRTKEQIEKEIEQIRTQIYELKQTMEDLYKEKSAIEFEEFCEKYGVKKGDVVKTKNDRFIICGPEDKYRMFWVRVRRFKKNGEVYKMTTYVSPNEFDGYEIIGHIDDEQD